MKRVLLHIGTGKTGSSAIQMSLARAAETGTLTAGRYPVQRALPGVWARRRRGRVAHWSPPMWPSHNFMPALYAPYERLPRLVKAEYPSPSDRVTLQGDVEAYRADLLAHITAHDDVLLSAEFLCQLHDDEVGALAADLDQAGVDEIAVLLYVRYPPSRYLSSVQQSLKAASTFASPTRFHDAFLSMADTWRRHFDTVRVRPFEREQLRDGDVVRDLLATCDEFFPSPTAGPEVQVVRANESISAEGMLLLQEFQAEFHADTTNVFHRDALDLLRVLERSTDAVTQTTPRLGPELRRLVAANHADDLAALRTRYGVTFVAAGQADTSGTGTPEPDPSRRWSDLTRVLASYDREALEALRLHCLRQALKAQHRTRSSAKKTPRATGASHRSDAARLHATDTSPESVRDRRHRVFARLLGMFPTGRCIDLGTGHGTFARRAANAGWEVTAVDVRTERWPDDPRVRWVKADVRDVELHPYELVLCLGLLHHMTAKDQLALFDRAAGRPLIIDTHVDYGEHTQPLSDPVTCEGYRGRWYSEPPTSNAAWGTEQSFWPTLESLHQMLAAHGYDTVTTVEPWYLPDRTFFVALAGDDTGPRSRPASSSG